MPYFSLNFLKLWVFFHKVFPLLEKKGGEQSLLCEGGRGRIRGKGDSIH